MKRDLRQVDLTPFLRYVMGWVGGYVDQNGFSHLFYKNRETGNFHTRADYFPSVYETSEEAIKAAKKNEWYGKEFSVFVRVYCYETQKPQPSLTLLKDHQGPTSIEVYTPPKKEG
jgi:hypothetical protein